MGNNTLKPVGEIDLSVVTKYVNYNVKALSNALPDYTYEDLILKDRNTHYIFVYDLVNNILSSTNFETVIVLGNKELDNVFKLVTTYKQINFIWLLNRVDIFSYLMQNSQKYNLQNLDVKYVNFNFYSQTELVYRQIVSNKKTLIFINDLLEHLDDPIPVIRLVKNTLKLNQYNQAVLCTSIRDPNNFDVPANKAHYREWTEIEMMQFLKSLGLNLLEVFKHKEKSSLIIRFNLDNYSSFIKQHFNTDLNKQYFLVSADHKNIFASLSSIRTCATDLQRSYNNLIQIVFIDIQNRFFNLCKKYSVLHYKLFFTNEVVDKLINLDSRGALNFDSKIFTYLTYEFVYYLNYYFDIQVIEFQDFLGLAFRVIQAKKAGLLQEEILIRVHAQGNHIYFAHIRQQLVNVQHLMLASIEKYTIENCDILTIQSEYLKNLYNSFGIDVAKGKIVKTICSDEIINLNNLAHENQNTQIKELIFISSNCTHKEFNIFLDTVQHLLETNKLKDLRTVRIYTLTKLFPISNDLKAKLNKIKNLINIGYLKISRQNLLKILTISRNSLCVFHYNKASYSCTALEEILHSQQFLLAVDDSDVEFIEKEHYNQIVCNVDVKSLSKNITSIIELNRTQRYDLYTAVFDRIKNLIKQENKNALEYIVSLLSLTSQSKSKSYEFPFASDVTVVIPVYNTKLEQVKDAIYSLNIQTVKPKEVIIVDDGSEEKYASELKVLLEKHSKFEYKLIRQENKGLAGARNTALANCTTKYLLNLDSDDCLHPESISILNAYMEKNQHVAGCCSFMKSFPEEECKIEELNKKAELFHMYLQTYVLGIIQNLVSSANTIFKVDVLREIGGWDDQDKSKWEDWSLGIKLTCRGFFIDVLPLHIYYYRVRKDSMVRTYDISDAQLRLVRNNILLPRFDSYVEYCLYQHAHHVVYVINANGGVYIKDGLLNSLSFRIYEKLYNKFKFLCNKYPLLNFFYVKISYLLRKLLVIQKFLTRITD
ncbi:MAG: glycosyltransferase [Candidatus Dojkabacteria bacterium]|nr:glycosyltransferase [Candidatus Dojkabacteria bacterium]